MTPVSSPVIDSGSPIRVLIAEDEAHLGTILEQFMTARGFYVRIVRDGRSALEQLQQEAFDVALLDVVMPELDGLEVLRLVRERPLPPEIIVITGNGTIETAMAALKLGAYDCLSKPYRMAEIDALVRRAWEKRMLVREHRYAQELRHRDVPTPLVTQFAPLRAVLDMVGKFTESPLPVLVSGATGTGKRTIARHLHGGRASAAFVEVDCANYDDDQQVIQIFGDPTSLEPTLGALELASRGTLLLRHVETLGPRAQAGLLAALDAGKFHLTADKRRVPTDARIVATTSRDLGALASAGRFDEVLLHRLGALRVALPTLRDRRIDIPMLAEHILERSAGTRGCTIDTDALLALDAYAWPGNVRELELVLERAAFHAEHGIIPARSLGLAASAMELPAASSGGAVPPAATVEAPSLSELERRHIAEVLERCGWHQGRAAEQLGISPKTLYRKIREYGFKRPSGRNS
ncbi:sigma-54 dependent transcriptional regulator [Gemmatimonas sp.]